MQRDRQTLTSEQAERINYPRRTRTNTNSITNISTNQGAQTEMSWKGYYTDTDTDTNTDTDTDCIRMPIVGNYKNLRGNKSARASTRCVFYGPRWKVDWVVAVDVAHFVLHKLLRFFTQIVKYTHSAHAPFKAKLMWGLCLKVSACITHRWLIDWLN